MDERTEAREFLTACRGRVRAHQVGLPDGGDRRVPGLRREEVAALAGVSVHYYTRLERGDLSGASPSVLDSLARALLLTDAEREHLFNLASAASVRSGRRAEPRTHVPPGLQQMIDAMSDAPTDLRSHRREVLASNALGRALYEPMYREAGGAPNAARFTFLDPAAREFFRDWEQTADGIVAGLRAEAGRAPRDRELSDLVGELAVRSEDFRVRWAAHQVRHHQAGVKRLRHPLVGDLDLRFQVLLLPEAPGLGVVVHTAEPGSPSADKLRILASWAKETPVHPSIPQERSAPGTESSITPGEQT